MNGWKLEKCREASVRRQRLGWSRYAGWWVVKLGVETQPGEWWVVSESVGGTTVGAFLVTSSWWLDC